MKIAAEHNKSQIVLGLEPTGHYWFCLATWMISNGISVVQVNPYAVKQTKEVENSSQLKEAPFPDNPISLGESEIRQIWHDARLRGRG